MCHPRHLIYLFILSLGVMCRVSTVSHLHVAHDDDITTHLANCDENYKFAAYTYSILQKFAIDNKVIVRSHSETMRKLHVWRTSFDKVMKRSASISYKLDILLDAGIGPAFIENDLLSHAACIFFELPSTAVDLSRNQVLSPPP